MRYARNVWAGGILHGSHMKRTTHRFMSYFKSFLLFWQRADVHPTWKLQCTFSIAKALVMYINFDRALLSFTVENTEKNPRNYFTSVNMSRIQKSKWKAKTFLLSCYVLSDYINDTILSKVTAKPFSGKSQLATRITGPFFTKRSTVHNALKLWQ